MLAKVWKIENERGRERGTIEPSVQFGTGLDKCKSVSVKELLSKHNCIRLPSFRVA